MFPGKPEQNVHVMAAFLQDHAGRKTGIAPVAAHKAVCLMPVADRLNGLNVDGIADGAAVKKLLDLLIERRIAQNMADGHFPVARKGEVGKFTALRCFRCDGLFKQQMVVLEKRFLGLGIMAAVRRADQHDIGQARLGEHFFCRSIAGAFVDPGQTAHTGQLFRIDVSSSDDFCLFGHVDQDFGVGVLSAGAASGNCDGNGSIHSVSLFFYVIHSIRKSRC